MKINKVLVLLLTATIAASATTINAKAESIGFDPVYYFNEYPDVAVNIGADPGKLYQHYVLFGVKEGRYQNQWEEDNGLTNTSGLNVAPTYNIQPIPGYDNYVDIDISDQVVTYFENGAVKLQAPCVSGLDNGKRNTPYGTYKVLTKVPGKRLKGKTWNCWVDRWMKFTNSNIGLHDASWRKEFGGQIYKTNGSHGCVNLPKDAAYQLYDLVNVGTNVVVHE